MTTATVTTGAAISESLTEFVADDRYIVAGEAVDLQDPIDPCSCGALECCHVAAATIAQARRRAA